MPPWHIGKNVGIRFKNNLAPRQRHRDARGVGGRWCARGATRPTCRRSEAFADGSEWDRQARPRREISGASHAAGRSDLFPNDVDRSPRDRYIKAIGPTGQSCFRRVVHHAITTMVMPGNDDAPVNPDSPDSGSQFISNAREQSSRVYPDNSGVL
jgi:hypothetical protein